MVLTQLSTNSITMDGFEQGLFSTQTVLRYYETKIFFSNMVEGDEIIVKHYTRDVTGASEKLYRTIPIRGIQDDPALVLNFDPTNGYGVTCEQTKGSFKLITWVLYGA